MKTLRPLPVAVLLAALPLVAPAAEAAPKDYTLFMGLDLAVQREKDFVRVRDVEGGSFVIREKGREQLVPMRTGSGSLKIDQGLKVTATSATIDQLKTERAYSPENDPYEKFGSRSGRAQSAEGAQTLAGFQQNAATVEIGYAKKELEDSFKTGNQDRITFAENRMTFAEINATRAGVHLDESTYSRSFSDFNNSGSDALALQQELAEENFDAMRYSFTVSAERELKRPYVVCIVRFHERNAKPGTGGTTIYAKALEPIGARPAKVTLIQYGLPKGFIVEECQVRLYDAGHEVATNVAPRRLPMTRDEAHQYLRITRRSQSKGTDQPASPALGRLDEEARARLTLDQFRATYYVKVTKDGLPEGAFLDETCTQPVNEALANLIGNVRFYPALEKNTEKPGIAKLVFPQIPI